MPSQAFALDLNPKVHRPSPPHARYWCSIPDDYIDNRRFPLFFARDVLQALVAGLKAENAVAP